MIRLELERRKRGLTLRTLGEKVKITPSELCRIENQRTVPYPGHLKRLEKYFTLLGEELLKEVK